MWKLFGLLFFFCARQSVVVSLSLCSTKSPYLEVKEGRSDNIFTCTGFEPNETVNWMWSRRFWIQCPPLPSPCMVNTSTLFDATRTSGTTSQLTVHPWNITDPNIFGMSSLACRTSTQIACELDFVYPAENSRCQVQFDGNTWQVSAWCSVSKVRSARSYYRCLLYQIPEASQTTLVGYYTMSVVPASSGYFSGTCNMTSYLPPEGRNSYRVIMPGEVNVSATFIGNNIISVPRVKPTHNCPSYLNEGDNLNCSCSVSDLGNPPGILRWNNTNSNRLEFRNILKSQNGIQSVCSLTWNNIVYQNVSYTLIVAYISTRLNFTMNSEESENVDVVENSTVTMKCEADGRPAPRMTISKVSDNSTLKTIPQGNITVGDQRGEVIYTVAVAQCRDSDIYRCTAANSLGMTETSVSLIVKCPPRVKPTHNCPSYLNEGDNLSCSCFVSDLGNPPGILRWNNTSSNRLEFRNLQKSQNGIQSVCSLIWNNTVHQSVSYTLIVAYRFTRMSLTMKSEEGGNISVVENSTVTMKCQADGRPAPRMTFIRDSDNSVLKTIPEGNMTVEDQRGVIIYTVAMAQCSDSGKYRCTAANSQDIKQQSFSLYVKCQVKVLKLTLNTTTLYKAVVSNALGSVALNFEVLPPNPTESEKNDDVTSSEFSRGHKAGMEAGLAVGLGLAAAEAVVVGTVCLVFCWRRKQRTSKAKGGRENTGYSSRQEHESVYEVVGNNETGQTAVYANVEGSHLSSRKTSNKTDEGASPTYVNLK